MSRLTWYVGKKVELTKKGNHYVSWRYMGNKLGYNEYEVSFELDLDGSLTLSEGQGEGFIYLYPEQVKHLKKILKGGK